jgi:O-antigen/teichoic acid export membrane protein
MSPNHSPDGPAGEGPSEPSRFDRADLQDRAMRGVSWTLIHTAVSLPVAFVANLVVARLLGVEDYGRLAFLMTFMMVAGGIVTLGVGIGLLQFASRAHAGGRADDVRALLSKTQGFRLLFVAPLLSAGVLLVADGIPLGQRITAVVLGVWLPAAFDGALFCVQIEGKSDLGAKIAMVVNLCTQVVVVAAAWMTRSPDAVWLARLAVLGLTLLLYLAAADKGYRAAVLRPALPRGFPPGFWRFALPSGLAAVIGTLALSRTEVFFLTWLSTPASVGVFALAFGLANHLFAPAEAVVGPLVPAVSGLHEVDRGSLIAAFGRVLRASSAGIALMCAVGLPTLALLVPVLYGSEYDDTGPLLLGLGAAGAILSSGGAVSVFTVGRLSGNRLMLVNTAALVVDVALALALIPSIGAWGAVIAISSATVVRFVLLLVGEVRTLAIPLDTVVRGLFPVAVSIPVSVVVYLVLQPLPAVAAAACAAPLGLISLVVLQQTFRAGLTEADVGALARNVPGPLRGVTTPLLRAVTVRETRSS